MADEGYDSPDWHRTELARERLAGNELYEEPDHQSREGYWNGRTIIARDTEIVGGVYLGAGEREAIVVDDLKYPNELNEAYSESERWFYGNPLSKLLRRTRGETIFEYIHNISKKKLGGNQDDIEEKVRRFVDKKEWEAAARGSYSDVEIPLNDFIKVKAGVCRHRALLAGYLLERLIQNGHMTGSVSIDRNTIRGKGGHAWVRYESADKRNVIIIDPSLGYVGNIEKAPSIWNYKRPGDTQRIKHELYDTQGPQRQMAGSSRR